MEKEFKCSPTNLCAEDAGAETDIDRVKESNRRVPPGDGSTTGVQMQSCGSARIVVQSSSFLHF